MTIEPDAAATDMMLDALIHKPDAVDRYVVSGVAQRAADEIARLRAENGRLREALAQSIQSVLESGYGSPSTWGDRPPTQFRFGRDTGEPLTPEQAAQHDNGVMDAYRAMAPIARAALAGKDDGE